MSNARFFYFGHRNSMIGHGGIVVACSQYDRDCDIVSIGFAFCNPCDMFNKRLGRKIAEGRMLKAKHSLLSADLHLQTTITRFAISSVASAMCGSSRKDIAYILKSGEIDFPNFVRKNTYIYEQMSSPIDLMS